MYQVRSRAASVLQAHAGGSWLCVLWSASLLVAVTRTTAIAIAVANTTTLPMAITITLPLLAAPVATSGTIAINIVSQSDESRSSRDCYDRINDVWPIVCDDVWSDPKGQP